jgi:hypothetical protein
LVSKEVRATINAFFEQGFCFRIRIPNIIDDEFDCYIRQFREVQEGLIEKVVFWRLDLFWP